MSFSAARYLPGMFAAEASRSGQSAEAKRSGGNDPAAPVAEGSIPAPDALPSAVDRGQPHAEVADEVLIAQICRGEQEALACLFRRYARLVRGVALRILRDKSEADDLLQEVFLFIHRKCRVFDASKGSARSWIVQMTYHRAIDRRRYLHSRHFYTGVDLQGERELDRRSDNEPYQDLVSAMVGHTTVRGLLDTLTEDQRNTLNLHFFEGYAFDEIAAKLDQSLGNVRNHYYRGLERLRKRMFPPKLPGRNGHGKK
jgi:RNA polymerase sigma-70 factor (ECF subfamily)